MPRTPARVHSAPATGGARTNEFRKDALEVGAELLGSRLGKTLAEVLPVEAKDWFIKILGGPDGTITEQQIAVFSTLPKFLLRGTISEEGAQNFVRSFGQEMRAYGMNPHPDRDQRRKDLKKIFSDSLNATSEVSAPAVPRQNLSEAIASSGSMHQRLFVALLTELREKRVMFQSQGGTKVSAFDHIRVRGQDRYVNQAWFSIARVALELNKPKDAALFLVYAVDLGEPIPVPKPPAPKERTFGDDVEDLAKEVLASVGKGAKEAFKAPDPNAPLSPVSRWAQGKTAEYRKLLGKTP